MSLKPWREIAVPHPDVLEGTFLQSEFAADITAVHTGKATREYQDAAAFFERTFITEGMRPTRGVRIRPADWPDVHLPREEYLNSGNFRHEERFPTPAIFPKY